MQTPRVLVLAGAFALVAGLGSIDRCRADSGNSPLDSGGGPAETPPSNGHPLLPPKWAFGVLFGTYHDQKGVLQDMARLRSEGYGGDLIWIDSSWLGHN